jgi:hypothetical protein
MTRVVSWNQIPRVQGRKGKRRGPVISSATAIKASACVDPAGAADGLPVDIGHSGGSKSLSEQIENQYKYKTGCRG